MSRKIVSQSSEFSSKIPISGVRKNDYAQIRIRNSMVYAYETTFVNFRIKHVLGHKTGVTIYRNELIPAL